MTDYTGVAKHVRDYIAHDAYATVSYDGQRQEALASLDALLAERQQAIDALRKARTFLPDWPGHAMETISAALVKLGEKP